MIFKEIAFDLPYMANENDIARIMNEKNCLRNDATKIDYVQNWKMKRRNFSLQTRCVSSMFERLMGKIITKKCSKLLIECVPDNNETALLEFSEVSSVKMKFDYDNFMLLDNLQKKKTILELLMKGVQTFAKKEALDYEQFVVVYNQIVELDYINRWIWKKSIKSPSKKHSAELVVKHDVEMVIFMIVIKDSMGNEVKTEDLLTELPDEYAYANHLGNLTWSDDKSVTLINKKGDQSWTVSI